MDTGHGEQNGPHSEGWWAFVAQELADYNAQRNDTWGGIDENLLACYAAGMCTEEETIHVESVMRDFPAIRESVDMARELTDSGWPVTDSETTHTGMRSRLAHIPRWFQAAAALLIVGMLGLAVRYWMGGRNSTPVEEVNSMASRAKKLIEAPSDSPAVAALRRDALRLRLEAYGQASENEALSDFLKRSQPTTLAGRQAELKTQVAIVSQLMPPSTLPKQPLLFCRLPESMQPGAAALLEDARRFAAAGGDIDPALEEFLARSRLPGDQLGMIVPACFQLSNDAGLEKWDRLVALGRSGRRIKVIMSYGIETPLPDPLYVEAFGRAKAAGIEVLAYVNCDGGGRDMGKIKAELKRWHEYYPDLIRGVFFDNQSPDAEINLDFFAEAFGFARTLDRRWLIVGCPIAESDEECLTKTGADIICRLNEGQELSLRGWEAKHDPSRFAVMIRGVDDPAAVPAAIERAAAGHFGWVYVTDSVGLPDGWPFASLPNYLPEEAVAIDSVNAAIGGRSVGAMPKTRSRK